MNKILYPFYIVFILSFTACGQPLAKQNSVITNKKMNTSKLTNETVKLAFNAWQNGDSNTFLSYFTADSKLYDDGNLRDFKTFVK